MSEPATPPPHAPPPPRRPGPLTEDPRAWAMAAHLLGLTGIIGPLVVWLIGRDRDEFIDDQGKEAVNFQLMVLIVMTLAAPLVCVFVGVIIEALVLVLDVVLCIVAATRAYNGQRYRYPLPLRLLQ